MSDHVFGWFFNRKQCVQSDGLSLGFLNTVNGVPQCSVLGTTLFTIYMNEVGQNINAAVHLYADDTVIYCCASSVAQVFTDLQSAFDPFQVHLSQLRLVLNAGKTNFMFFSNKKKVSAVLPSITSAQGTPIESVATYKYLGITVDDSLSFKCHVDQLLK